MQVSASVLSDDMEILTGVAVQEVGTNNTTQTDQYGKFSLNVSSGNSQVKFTLPGYYYETYSASQVNTEGIVYMGLENSLNPVDVQNNYKAADNTLWYVLAGIAAVTTLAIVANNSKPQPKKIKV